MKRIFLASLTIIIFLFSGCKKDNNSTHNTAKTYLLKTLTRTVFPANNSSQEQFTYDDKNRVIDFKSSRGEYKYTYDGNNNLTTVQNYDQAGTFFSTNKFTYANGEVDVQTTDVGDNGGQPYIFTLNSLGQVSSSTIDNNKSFTYDSNGNLTKGESDTYTYDNKKNPLSMIGAKNLHLMYIPLDNPSTFVNNVITDANLASPYTYVYNSDGFPISASTTPTSITPNYVSITYEYIVK